MNIALNNISKSFGSFAALEGCHVDHSLRPARGSAGPFRIGEDHPSAHHRRAWSFRREARSSSVQRLQPGSRPEIAG